MTPASIPRVVSRSDGRFYRIGVEAINNAFRHAHARTIHVELAFLRLSFIVRVRDDGRGFDTAELERSNAGLWGLKEMLERAANVQGRLAVHSTPEDGTVIELTVSAWRAYRDTRRLGF